MAYAIVHHFPAGTQAQYEASIAAVHPAGGSLPDGQIFHAAGPLTGGWTITAVHESQESWQRFRDETLVPKMQAGIEGGFPGATERDRLPSAKPSASGPAGLIATTDSRAIRRRPTR